MSAKKSKRTDKRATRKRSSNAKGKGVTQIHDSFFKLSLKDKEIAQEVLDNYLPEHIKPLCDFSTLNLEPNSFITDDLKQKFNDILYSVNTKKGKGYIYFLLEAQTTADKFIALRMMSYALLAIQESTAQHKLNKAPLVIPMLFYFNKKAHRKSIPLNWLDSFADPQLVRQIFTHDFALVDMATIDDEDLRSHPKSGLMFYLEKHIRYRDLMQLEPEIVYYLSRRIYSTQYLKSVLIYICNEGRISKDVDFLGQLQTKFPQYQEVHMTIAEQLRQEGEQRGLEKGEQQGLYKASITIAKNMLEKGLDIDLIQSTTNLSEDEIKALMH